MTEPVETLPKAPTIRTGLLLWALGLVGGLLVLPYATRLAGSALAAAAVKIHLQVWQILALQEIQLAVLLAVAVALGLWSARKVGLGAPIIAALFGRGTLSARTWRSLLVAIIAGIAAGGAVILLARFAFASADAALAHGLVHPPTAWLGFLASFYGAFDEELLMRLGLLAPLALLARTVMRWFGADRCVALPSAAFWCANILTAVLFGLGHLPATAALAPLTTLLVLRAIVLNGVAGIVFGVLYRRYGLEWAMLSHFSADLVLHVFVA